MERLAFRGAAGKTPVLCGAVHRWAGLFLAQQGGASGPFRSLSDPLENRLVDSSLIFLSLPVETDRMRALSILILLGLVSIAGCPRAKVPAPEAPPTPEAAAPTFGEAVIQVDCRSDSSTSGKHLLAVDCESDSLVIGPIVAVRVRGIAAADTGNEKSATARSPLIIRVVTAVEADPGAPWEVDVFTSIVGIGQVYRDDSENYGGAAVFEPMSVSAIPPAGAVWSVEDRDTLARGTGQVGSYSFNDMANSRLQGIGSGDGQPLSIEWRGGFRATSWARDEVAMHECPLLLPWLNLACPLFENDQPGDEVMLAFGATHDLGKATRWWKSGAYPRFNPWGPFNQGPPPSDDGLWVALHLRGVLSPELAESNEFLRLPQSIRALIVGASPGEE